MSQRQSANPFAQDVLDPLPGPATLVIFGATGDLTARKLLPALYSLATLGRLPDLFRVVGVARRGTQESYINWATEAIKRHCHIPFESEAVDALIKNLSYVTGDFDDPKLYERLASTLSAQDASGGETQKLFYLAVSPSFFSQIASNLHAVGLARDAVPSTKLIVEKPFGHDLESARELDSALKASFTESQTFRIDHYLAKETVQNLLVLRFANGIFEPVWNRRYIDHVQLTVAEDLGIGHRVGYYDNSGALRDVVQNHMLQLLSLVAMEPPIYFNADEIRDEKVKALHAIKALDVSDVPEQVVKGQYQSGWIGGEPVPGYGDEDAVPDGSLTDTFVAMRLELDNWRWGGTPFYLRTGKRLPTKATEIAIVFRPVPHSPFQRIDLHQMVSNQLVISVQPNEGASLRMMAKVPGSTMDVRPVQMDFQYGASFLRESPEAYERVLHDALIGDATLFTRSDEVEAAWRTVDPILKEWESSLARPYPYAAGSTGPEAARTLIERDGRNWRPL